MITLPSGEDAEKWQYIKTHLLGGNWHGVNIRCHFRGDTCEENVQAAAIFAG
jgi:hypothetical protein